MSEDLTFSCLENDENNIRPHGSPTVPCKSIHIDQANDSLSWSANCKLPRLSHEQCASYFAKEGIKINQNQICHKENVYFVPEFCKLDKGGPIVELEDEEDEKLFYPVLVALNQFGNDCGYGFPAVATRVSQFYDWIEETIFGHISLT